ncbi:hypothetical protein C1H46_012396 [Malus baccata]|uniref:Uncharacterized protein n=1 Tax=Malus baccata TaxID=106549 RepID=A0A540MT55_MALBA|nr:hypothetical protein C1H46_012396 [Malus baccata]
MVLGKITVAGKESYGAGKESYGAGKQQHTFTGRNLYKLRTYRQRWSEEAERSKVLAEKQRRGEAARRVRAMKKSRKLTENREDTAQMICTYYILN